jgi:transposase
MRAYSQDLRYKVISKYIEGSMKMTEISKLFGICYESVRDWIKRYKKDGDYSSKQGVGCGRAVRFTDKNQILEYLKSYPDASGVEMRDAIVPNLPISTFYDTLARLKITYKKRAEI